MIARMKILSTISMIWCAAILLLPMSGRSDVPSVGIRVSGSGSVQIINNSHDTLRYRYRSGGRKWKNLKIRPGDNDVLPCSDAGRYYPEIEMKTGGKRVRYTLECWNRYVLYWNPSGEHWDVRLLRD